MDKIKSKFILFSFLGLIIVSVSSFVSLNELKKILLQQDQITELYSIMNNCVMSVHQISLSVKQKNAGEASIDHQTKEKLGMYTRALMQDLNALDAWIDDNIENKYLFEIVEILKKNNISEKLHVFLSRSTAISDNKKDTPTDLINNIEYLSINTQIGLGKLFSTVNPKIFQKQKEYISKTERIGMVLVSICLLEILFVWFFVFKPLYTTVIDQHEGLKRSAIEASKANKAKSEFLANISHEIRTPMTAILGYLDVLRNKRFSSEEEKDDAFNIINRNADHLLDLIDELLDISKIEAGKLETHMEIVELMPTLNEIYSIMNAKASKKELSFEIDYDTAVPKYIYTDPKRFKQILYNLIGNAIKFTDQGSVQIHISRNQKANKRFLEIRIMDTGIGIEESQLKKLFLPFSQADTTNKRKFGGTGLGLVISQRLAKKMGGELIVEKTEPGKGTTFLLTIEKKELPGQIYIENFTTHFKDAEKFSAPPFIDDSKPLKDKTILVVDDAKENTRLFEIYLKKAGANVSTAYDGNEALDKINSSNFDIVLLDLQMPGKSGYEVMKALKEQSYSKPVYALTAHAMNEEKIKTAAAGFTGHITKPVKSEDLIQILKNA